MRLYRAHYGSGHGIVPLALSRMEQTMGTLYRVTDFNGKRYGRDYKRIGTAESAIIALRRADARNRRVRGYQIREVATEMCHR